MTATAVNLSFDSGNGTFVGVAANTYVIMFDKKFQTATITCEGAVFSPGVNPFELEAEPIPNSEFNCGAGIEFHRVPIGGEDDNN